MSEEGLPIEQALTGLKIHPLNERWTALEAFVLIKSIDHPRRGFLANQRPRAVRGSPI